MKKEQTSVSNPDELNKYLQRSSFVVWLILGIVASILIAFFVWSMIYKVKVKISGLADISGGEVTLHVEEKSLNQLEVGQKVYIQNQELEISSFDDNKQPIVTKSTLEDGEYPYYIVIKEAKPIEFLIGK